MDETFFVLIGLLVFLALLGGILGWIAFFKSISNKSGLEELDKEVNRKLKESFKLTKDAWQSDLKRKTKKQVMPVQPKSTATEGFKTPYHRKQLRTEKTGFKILMNPDILALIKSRRPDLSSQKIAKTSKQTSRQQLTKQLAQAKTANVTASTGTQTSNIQPQKTAAQENPWIEKIKQNWMIWLGGVCVALAGIFYVRYSIEQGLLGPIARLGLSGATAVVFHIIAYRLYLKKGQHDSFAALAGGASIMLYASLIAALHLYELVSPITVFILLAVVSTVTMLLSLKHGPVLAGIGIIGAYLVPIFVSQGGGLVEIAMIYALIVTAGALGLLRYVYRTWLWAGVLGFSTLWWLAGLGESFAFVYLAVLTWMLFAIPTRNWFLLQANPLLKGNLMDSIKQPSQLLLILAASNVFSMVSFFAIQDAYFGLALLVLLVPFLSMVLTRNNQTYTVIHWPVMLGLVVTSLVSLMNLPDENWVILDIASYYDLLVTLMAFTAFFTGFCWWQNQNSRFNGYWVSLFTMTPILMLTPAYAVSAQHSPSWLWSLGLVILGLSYLAWIFFKNNQLTKFSAAAYVISAHASIGLAATFSFSDATLTLLLASQILSLVWVSKYFKLSHIDWLIKLIAAVLILRLTFNPFVLNYTYEHNWTLITYGGSFVLAFAAFTINNGALKKWLEGLSLHLFMLLFVTQVRYWVYDGDVFAASFQMVEVGLLSLLWAVVAMVYYNRMIISESLKKLYKALAFGFATASASFYVLFSLLIFNPLWHVGSQGWVSSTPVFNLLLLNYLAPVGLLLAAYQYVIKDKRFLFAAAVSAFIFSILEIHHLWLDGNRWQGNMQDGEIYTYSVVWLVTAILGISYAYRIKNASLYKYSMIFLLMVIGKIFLMDMHGLEGLMRVSSFMGLGLTLLVLAYVHQKNKALMS